jgi:hypothetical protein
LQPPKPPPKKGKKVKSEEADEDESDETPKKPGAADSKKESATPSADEDEDEEESPPAKAKSGTPSKKDDAAENEDDESGGDEKPAKAKKKSDDEGDEEAKSDEDAEAAAPKKPKVGEKAAGRTNVADAIEEATGVSAKLPVALKRSDVPSSALAAGKFKEGHVVVEGVGGKVPKSEAVTQFAVPEDLVMVQIGAAKTFAGSTLGQALEFAKQTLAQIFVTSEAGDQYFALGVYTAATVNGKRILELQYWPEKREQVPERALEPSKRLTTNLLKTAANQNNLKMGFLFLVPKGAHLVKFNTTSRNGQPIDIQVE